MKPEYTVRLNEDGETEYVLSEDMVYWSERYGNFKTVPAGYVSDGATGAIDIHTCGWWVHDAICDSPFWDDDEPISAWQAAMVLRDCLKTDGYKVRSFYWHFATFLFGCHKARDNGWF
jgi:hypothetical protein